MQFDMGQPGLSPSGKGFRLKLLENLPLTSESIVAYCSACSERPAKSGGRCERCLLREKRADQQRNRRHQTHIPSVRIPGEQAEEIVVAAEEVTEAVWAFHSHMKSIPDDVATSPALRVAAEMARAAERLDQLLGQSLSEVGRARQRRTPKRNRHA